MLDVRFDIHGKDGILVKAVSCKLPETFSELTSEELILLCRALKTNSTEYELKLLILHERAKLSPVHNEWLIKNKSGLYELFKVMNIELINATSDRNILPVIEYEGKTYIGPLGDFSNVTLEQFGLTENLFHGYLMGSDIKAIKLLAEALWLTEGRKFNKSVINDYAPVFENLPDEQITAIIAVYSAMRNALFKRFPTLFPLPVEDETPKDTKHAQKPLQYDFDMYPRIIDDMAGGKFGTYQETCQAIVTDVLYHLNRLANAA